MSGGWFGSSVGISRSEGLFHLGAVGIARSHNKRVMGQFFKEREGAMKDMRISRRHILQGAGAVSVIGALGIPGTGFAEEGEATGQLHLDFAALSQAASPGAKGVFLMAGDGRFTSSHIKAQGMFQHVDPTTPQPNVILSAGAWKATKLVSFTSIGTYGVQAAGILKINVDLVQTIPSPAVTPATLTVVCNIPFVPLMTGKPEGFSLEAPFGSFGPQSPTVGITIFSMVNEAGKGD